MGGINLYQYAPNPVEWVDSWGWAYKPIDFPVEKVIVERVIQLQGSRSADFREANKQAGLLGKQGHPTIRAHKDNFGDVTWHHVDYDPKTNEARMQLVARADHEANLPHSGSVSDFEKTHGVKYETAEAKEKAKKLNSDDLC